MELKVEIPVRVLYALKVAAARYDERPALNGIKVEIGRDAVTLIATDGHMLAAHRMVEASGVEGEFIIPIQLLKGSFLWIDKVHFVYADDRVSATVDDITRSMAAITAPFPAWRNVIPAPIESVDAAEFNPGLLRRMEKVARRLFGKSPRIAQNGHGGALATVEGEPSFVGVVMPLKHVDPPTEAPAWARPVKRSTTEAA